MSKFMSKFWVGKNDNSILVLTFATEAEAEAKIAEYEKSDPDGVHNGEYYLDADEEYERSH